MPEYKLQKSGQTVRLSDKDFVADGGEGAIYAKSGVAYKICHNGKSIPDGKIADLSILDRPHILKPLEVITTTKGDKVGYTMKFIPQNQCWPLGATFTNAFWGREGLDYQKALGLLSFMTENVQYIHNQQVLLVDLNEYNFLLDKSFDLIYFIDTNSYQTPHYPATAIMDSIRDRHTAKLSESSDWFSYAVLMFQFLTGIHPFRGGNHPSFTGSADEKMDKRMKQCISVFSPEVKYPKGAVRDFFQIPDNYLNWFKKVFTSKDRPPPPNTLSPQAIVRGKNIEVTGTKVKFTLLHSLPSDIVDVFTTNGNTYFLCDKHLVDGGCTVDVPFRMKIVIIDGKPYGFYIKNNRLACYNLRGGAVEPLKNEITCDDLMVYDNRLYIKCGDKLLQMVVTKIGNGWIISPHNLGSIFEHSSRFYKGFMAQKVFGANLMYIFPLTKMKEELRFKELDGHDIIDGEYKNGVLVTISRKNNKLFYTVHNYSETSQDEIADIFSPNFTVLDNRMTISILPNGNIELVLVNKGKSNKKVVVDESLNTSIRLFSIGSKVLFGMDDKVYEGKMV